MLFSGLSGQVNKSLECSIYAAAETPKIIDSPSFGTSASMFSLFVTSEMFDFFLQKSGAKSKIFSSKAP